MVKFPKSFLLFDGQKCIPAIKFFIHECKNNIQGKNLDKTEGVLIKDVGDQNKEWKKEIPFTKKKGGKSGEKFWKEK